MLHLSVVKKIININLTVFLNLRRSSFWVFRTVDFKNILNSKVKLHIQISLPESLHLFLRCKTLES